MSSLGVCVCIRPRPMIEREAGIKPQWSIDCCKVYSETKSFNFDQVFSPSATNDDVYTQIAAPIVRSAMEGFNGTVFAYGQTSSGKTHTMTGSSSTPGIIPLAIKDIFNIIEKTPGREFLLRMSYMEIYKDNLKDLLSSEPTSLSIREDEFKNVRVQGLVEEVVKSPSEVLHFLQKGEQIRQFGATNMNVRSSRSHTIFKMVVESREQFCLNQSTEEGTAVRVAQLNFVDLAGSERAHQTGADNQRLKEGCYINKSLMILGQVINQICKEAEAGGGKGFISFRDSKLTRILQSSLGGNSLTAIICTITLASRDETEGTLRFASRAKDVKNKPTVNEILSDEALLYRQKKEINQLRKKILELENEQNEKSCLQRNEYEEKIEVLTRMLLVSSGHDSVTSKKLRRETWCPGAQQRSRFNAAANFPLESQRDLSTLTTIPEDSFMSNFDTWDSPFVSDPGLPVKRKQFDESAVTTRKRSRQDDDYMDNLSDYANLQNIRDELTKQKEKNQVLNAEAKLRENVIEQFKQEKEEDDVEKDDLKRKIEQLSKKVVEFEKREIDRISSDSLATGLQNSLNELRGQLEETCRENRKLQENYDDEMDRCRSLNSTVEKLRLDLNQSKEEAEGYKTKMLSIQSQLEASKSSETHEKTVDTSTLLSTINEKETLISELQNSINDLQKELNCTKEKHAVNDSKVNMETSKLPEKLGCETSMSKSKIDAIQAACLEDAVQQGEMLFQEREKLKQQLDDLVFQTLDKDKRMEEMETRICAMTSQIHSLEEQAQFDRDEKEVLFAEEKELRSDVEKLKVKLEEANERIQSEVSVDQESLIKELKKSVTQHEKSANDAESLLRDSNFKLSQAECEVKELTSVLKEKEAIVNRLKADVESFKALSEIASGRKSTVRRSTDRSNEENEVRQKELEESISTYEKEVEVLKEKLAHTSDLLECEREAFNECNSALQEEICTKKEKIEKLEREAQLASELLQRLKSEQATYDEKLQERNEELACMEQKLEGFDAKLEMEKERERESYEADLREKSETIDRLQQKLEQYDRELIALCDEDDAKSTEPGAKDADEHQISDAVQQKQDYAQHQQEPFELLQNLKDECQALKDKNELLQQQTRELREESRDQREELNVEISKHEEVVKKLEAKIQLDLRESEAIRNECENLKKTVAERNNQVAGLEQELLQVRQQLARSSTLHRSEFQSINAAVANLQAKVQCNDQDLRIILKAIAEVEETSRKLLLVKRDYDVLRQDYALNIEQLSKADSEISQLKRSLNSMESVASLHEAERQSFADDFSKLHAKLSSSERELDAVKQQHSDILQKLNSEIQTKTEELVTAENDHDLLQQNLNVKLEELSKAQTEISELKLKFLESDETLTSTELERQKLNEALVKLQSEFESSIEELNLLKSERNTAIQNLKAEILEKSEKLEIAEREQALLRTNLAAKSEELVIAKDEISKCSHDAKESTSTLDAERQSLSDALVQLQAKCESLEAGAKASKSEHDAIVENLTAEIEKKSEKLKFTEDEHRLIKEDFDAHMEKLDCARAETSELKSKLESQECNEFNLIEALKQKSTLIEEKNAQINELSDKIASLQETDFRNSEALEELKVLQQRQNEWANERNEIEKASSRRNEQVVRLTSEKEELAQKLDDQAAASEAAAAKLSEELEDQKSLLTKKEIQLYEMRSESERAESKLAQKQAALDAAESDRAAQSSRCAALEEKVTNLELVLSGDDAKAEQVRLLEERPQLSEVEKNFIVVYHQYQQLTAEHQELVASSRAPIENDDCDRAVENELEEKLDAEQKKSSTLEDELKRTHQQVKDLKEQLCASAQVNQDLTVKLKVAQTYKTDVDEFRSVRSQLSVANQKLIDRARKCTELETQSRKNTDLLDEAKFALLEKKKALDAMEKKFEGGKKKFFDLQNDYKEALNSIETLTSDLAQSNQQRAALATELKETVQQQQVAYSDADITELESKCSKLKHEIIDQKLLVKSEQEKREASEAKIEVLEKKLTNSTSSHSTEMAKLTERNQLLESKLGSSKVENEKLKENIADLEKRNREFDEKLDKAIEHSKVEIEELSKKGAKQYIDFYQQEFTKVKELEQVYLQKKKQLQEEKLQFDQTKRQEKNPNVDTMRLNTKIEKQARIIKENEERLSILESKLSKANSLSEKHQSDVKRLQEIRCLKEEDKEMKDIGVQFASAEVFPGGVVQTTKLDIQELEMAQLKRTIKEQEKEIAKFKVKDTRQMRAYTDTYNRYQNAKAKIRELQAALGHKQNTANALKRQEDEENNEPASAITSKEKSTDNVSAPKFFEPIAASTKKPTGDVPKLPFQSRQADDDEDDDTSEVHIVKHPALDAMYEQNPNCKVQ